jgi:hypothetical protein
MGSVNLPGSGLGPFALLKKSIEELPAMKYALGVGGLIAVVVIIEGWGKIDLRIAPVAAIIMLVLMVALVVFAGLAAQNATDFRGPITVLTWFCLMLVMATGVVIFTSAFWKRPVDLSRLVTSPGSTPPPVDPRASLLLANLTDLERQSQDLDAWKSFERDYSELGENLVTYLHYVEENSIADPDGNVAKALQTALDKIKSRNDVNRTSQIKDYKGNPNPNPRYQAEVIPGEFQDLLEDIFSKKGKRDGISPQEELCYETTIRRLLLVNAGLWWNRPIWFDNAGFVALPSVPTDPKTPPAISDACRAIITVPSNI